MKRTLSGIMLTLLLIGMLTLAFNIQPVKADLTELYVDPAIVYASLGESFTVDIKIENVQFLHTWQVNMSFNPNVLSFTDVTEGDFLKKGGRETTGVKVLDHVTDGWALFSWSILGMFRESGSGILATVEFQVLKEGKSELKLEITPIWNDKNMDGVVDVYIHDESYVKEMGFDKDWDSWQVVWEMEKSELIFPSMLIKMNLPPVPPGGTELELISFAATDGFFTSIVSPPVAQATINIDPDTLNLKSRGKWITAYIELPEDCDASEIDLSTVKLNGEISAALHPTEIGDYDNNGILDLMVKFDRQDLRAILSAGEATLTITGQLIDGTPFEGSDTIRVLNW
ncbi:hypothetical protein KAU55_04320 [Candidatus Bathyarchaeota archaeon]|nr:hypothetical protein [Candidatus Bathyarchaeota archaeon]